jgi:hypothetical protein
MGVMGVKNLVRCGAGLRPAFGRGTAGQAGGPHYTGLAEVRHA